MRYLRIRCNTHQIQQVIGGYEPNRSQLLTHSQNALDLWDLMVN